MIKVNLTTEVNPSDPMQFVLYPVLAKHIDGEIWLLTSIGFGFRVSAVFQDRPLFKGQPVNMHGFTPLSKDEYITLRNI